MKKLGTLINPEAVKERFTGFLRPNTTPTPDELFDRFMTELTHAELKVLLYISRRTFGFGKSSDRISLHQIADGILSKDGHHYDKGAGIDRRTAMRTVKSLEAKGLIVVERVKTEDGYNNVNIYSLKFSG